MEIITTPKAWGNSLGIIISREKARAENIDENTQVIVKLKKLNPVSDVFGMLKKELRGFDTQKFKDELRREEKETYKRKFGLN